MMKANCTLLSVIFLSFLLGCNGNDLTDGIEVEEGKEIETKEGEDKDFVGGIPEPGIVGITIEYFDKEKKGNDSIPFEFISFKDEITGMSFIDEKTGFPVFFHPQIQSYFDIKYIYNNMVSFSPEWLSQVRQDLVRHYSIKYKVPSIRGQSVEEIKVVCQVYAVGYGRITEAWYNGKKIPLITYEAYNSGDLVAIRSAATLIRIIVPIKKP